MKFTEKYLRKVIREEARKVLKEHKDWLSRGRGFKSQGHKDYFEHISRYHGEDVAADAFDVMDAVPEYWDNEAVMSRLVPMIKKHGKEKTIKHIRLVIGPMTSSYKEEARERKKEEREERRIRERIREILLK